MKNATLRRVVLVGAVGAAGLLSCHFWFPPDVLAHMRNCLVYPMLALVLSAGAGFHTKPCTLYVAPEVAQPARVTR